VNYVVLCRICRLLPRKESDFMGRASRHILEVSLINYMDMIKTKIVDIEECQDDSQ